ncbi:MAG: 2-hydroxyacyl-CoA dehydratase [Candidatus Abyssobacteria bacterium SURF_17]|jgi:benzoyl-CoA reductase/2-hydroxyglutaryl-CoA dehydratase subunit BcrC/BadD/HgdB|uniref:2-hydroxyacyl-CoA dehydratase n=1 Tax=Candidatus Abyssobacteria bacterium SURF_17 TaxID=2093361 RepID=A0A419F1T3_9BACT|nr:MAG: 2-hydroxyacyl-CoA dehydratase [Candidatus Abyssubacteria bacterium SURF_17]
MTRRVGITSTIPVEVVLAAGDVPVDLNNVFISDPDPSRFIRYAEEAGYPRNICGWVKGLFGLVMSTRCVDTVIALTQGDCSSTLALVETLMVNDVPVIPFEYPFARDRDVLHLQVEKLARALDTSMSAAQQWVEKLQPLRDKLSEIDRLTWREGVVSGGENDAFLTSASDFEGSVQRFERKVDDFLARARSRGPISAEARIGYIGVPPIWNDFYEFIELQGAHVVFNEMQRQFSMPFDSPDIVDRYIAYTYPYGVFPRLVDIEAAISERALDGLIHYTQSFCFRQIEDLIFRKKLLLPILTLEGDQPGPLDGRTKLRINAFIEMIRKKRTECSTSLPVQGQWLPSNTGKDL